MGEPSALERLPTMTWNAKQSAYSSFQNNRCNMHAYLISHGMLHGKGSAAKVNDPRLPSHSSFKLCVTAKRIGKRQFKIDRYIRNLHDRAERRRPGGRP